MKARHIVLPDLEVIDARNGDGVLTTGRGPVLRTVSRPTQRGVGLDGVSAAIKKPELLRVRDAEGVQLGLVNRERFCRKRKNRLAAVLPKFSHLF